MAGLLRKFLRFDDRSLDLEPLVGSGIAFGFCLSAMIAGDVKSELRQDVR
ncbi:hypothetical protein JI435_301200 [Parastagonospora nodorum SN15]|uniref:Uncharacterized protein n=1 Tax=Phaeosphaeria nodorum (strain SN15 / ATCC MYA-4574 / FGSC 10173) TaxID=321614 RepID=A0A7U2ETF6_PHANO|nr:hypothetical protein JI435_301200 [Parastagonospora nodorum SN15]